MKLYVDQIKCASNGNCVKEYPELFRFSAGSKKAVAADAEIPVRHWKKYQEVTKICPVSAIKIVKE